MKIRIINRFFTLVSFYLIGFFAFTSVHAVCLDVNNTSHPCRFPEGDTWCIDNKLSPYAYGSKCLNNMAPPSEKGNATTDMFEQNTSNNTEFSNPVYQDQNYETTLPDENFNYFVNLIKEKIQQNWHPPAQLSGRPSVVVSLSIKISGAVDSGAAKIVTSSGIPLFDQSVISAIYKSSPLPVPSRHNFDKFRNLYLRFVLPDSTLNAEPVHPTATKETYLSLKDSQPSATHKEHISTVPKLKSTNTHGAEPIENKDVLLNGSQNNITFWISISLISVAIFIGILIFKSQRIYDKELARLYSNAQEDPIDRQGEGEYKYVKIKLYPSSLNNLKPLEDLLRNAKNNRLNLINSLNLLDNEIESSKSRLKRLSYVPFANIFLSKAYTSTVKRLDEKIKNSQTARLKHEESKVQIRMLLTHTQEDGYSSLTNAFIKLCNCNRTEEVISEVSIDKPIARSWAGTLINTRPAHLCVDESQIIDVIISEYKPLRFQGVDDTDILIFPLFVAIVYDNGDLEIIRFKDLNIDIAPAEFAEEREIPADTEVINTTWKYVNKNGTRDFRFSDNYEIPIVRYARLRFYVNNGFNRIYQMSDFGVTYDFWNAYYEYFASLDLESEKIHHDDRSMSTFAMTRDKAREILGVKIDATKEEIQSAYRLLVKKYHPDKVASLGSEFSVIAEKKTTEINLAYQALLQIKSA